MTDREPQLTSPQWTPGSGRRAAVLMGGISSERAVSLVTGGACARALAAKGYAVAEVDPSDEHWIAHLQRLQPDLVFNALHGLWGEDGRVQGVLEWLRLPYTHSGVLASALAMDKHRTKTVVRAAGVDVPAGQVVSKAQAMAGGVMEPPYVIKPVAEGSSVGVFLVRPGDNRPPAALAQHKNDDAWLIEEMIPGRELTVAVMDDRALAVTEIVFKTDFFDYEEKYGENGAKHVLPADLPKEIYDQCLNNALVAHHELGCRGLTRSDFRFDPETGRCALLEVNTQPGMTPTSLAPEQAAHVGIAFDDLVAWIAEDASCLR